MDTKTGGARTMLINAPTYAPLEGSDDVPAACGQVVLDLMQLDPRVARRTFVLYAFAGPKMAGPEPLSLIKS